MPTNGPDVVASADDPAKLAGLEQRPGVTDYSGPFPSAAAELRANGRTSDVQAVGREAAPASVDRPEVTRGGWVRDGGVVVEAAFADAFGLRVGDQVTLDGRSFEIVGFAVTAAAPPFPQSLCYFMCLVGDPSDDGPLPADLLVNPGLVWLTEADALSLVGGSPAYVLNLKLADPNAAQAFVDTHAGGVPAQTWRTSSPTPPNWPATRRSCC